MARNGGGRDGRRSDSDDRRGRRSDSDERRGRDSDDRRGRDSDERRGRDSDERRNRSGSRSGSESGGDEQRDQWDREEAGFIDGLPNAMRVFQEYAVERPNRMQRFEFENAYRSVHNEEMTDE
jgi:hypothetical protein